MPALPSPRFLRNPRLFGLVVGLVAAGALGACGDSRSVTAPPALSTAPAASAGEEGQAASPAPLAAVESKPAPAWLDAVRLEHYREARRLLDELDEPTKSTPEMRFLRARVAAEMKDPKAVQSLLQGVELPMFKEEIDRMRAEAALDVGPYPDAVAYFERMGRPRDLVRASRASIKAGDKKRAQELADRALRDAQRAKRQADERGAHAIRVELLVAEGKTQEAMPDLKWLALKYPVGAEGRNARKVLDATKGALSDKDRREIVDALLEAGAGKDALEALDKYQSAFKKPDLAHLRAHAHFKSRAYGKAAEAFLAAAKQDGPRTAEQLYYAARALGKSKKEDEAIKRYREVIRRFKKSQWVERSSFQLAQLLQNEGQYAAAVEAFTSYLAKYADGSSREDAEYALALAHLGAGEPKKARVVLGNMASRAKRTDWGFLRELEGVAALRAGDKDTAITIFTQVANEQPLTWGAAMSRARLSKLGAPLPPVVTPGPMRTFVPMDPALPPKAAQLVALGLDADAEAHLSENEGLVSSQWNGRETEALCRVYSKLSRAKRRYKVGASAVSFESLMRAPSDGDRWSWECLYPTPYRARVVELEKSQELAPNLLYALMRQESAFDPDARSPVGAEGLMQLMPTTAEQAAKEASFADFRPEDVTAPEVNLRIGSFYITKLIKTFNGSIPLAVAAYNGGPGAVSRWVEMAKEHEADVFVARIPYEETRNYVAKVMGNLLRYQWLAGGDAAVQSIPLELPSSARAGDDDY